MCIKSTKIYKSWTRVENQRLKIDFRGKHEYPFYRQLFVLRVELEKFSQKMTDSHPTDLTSKFSPKEQPELNSPKDDLISFEVLSACDGKELIIPKWPWITMIENRSGTTPSKPTYVAIMGTVFDVSGNKVYGPSGAYHGEEPKLARLRCSSVHFLTTPIVFAGKDASRALAQSSLKPEDCRPEYEDLGDKERGVLNNWFTFFSKRYNIVGKLHKWIFTLAT